MKKFIINTAVICSISLFLFFIVIYNTNGYTDPYYIKFTTPKQKSLIIGTSRAAQGLKPEIFKKKLDIDIYNYAFTVTHSPYGPVYLNSIKSKLDQNNKKNATFIVTVDPWSISSITKDPNNVKLFRENELCLANTSIVDAKPNFTYIFNNLSGKFATVITNYKRKEYVHENGWLEVSVSMDTASVEERIESKLKMYKEYLLIHNYSALRYEYLRETIKYLRKFGNVYLVRLPIHPKIMKIENELMPDFNEMMLNLKVFTNGYYDMTTLNRQYQYTDGNHLYKESSILVSENIANWIQKQ
jgi:hypothetical protein